MKFSWKAAGLGALIALALFPPALAAGAWGEGGASIPAGAAGEEEPLIEEDAGRPGGVEGAVRLSDGSVLRGKVSLVEGTKLRVYDARARRPFSLDLGEIAAIRTVVEREAMEEAWAFEEEGFRKKVRLGWKYPLRNYGQEVELRSGNLLVGHVYAVTVYVDDGKAERRFKLPRQDKGARGQTLADLVYVESIDLGDGKAPPKAFAALSGTVPGLLAAAAIDRRTLRGAAGKVLAGSPPRFRIDGLLPGRFSLFLRTAEEARIGLPGKLDLQPEERAAAEKRVAASEEFFDGKRVVLLAGDRSRLWALLELTRSGGTTLADDSGRSFRFRRWELWALRAEGKGGDGAPWRIDGRIFLDRAVVPADSKLPEPRYRIDPALEDLELVPGENPFPPSPAPGGIPQKK